MGSIITDGGRQGHLYSKGAIRTVATIFASGKFVSKLPEMADNLSNKIDNISKTFDNFSNNLFDLSLLLIFINSLSGWLLIYY